MEIIGTEPITNKSIGPCHYALFDLMINVSGNHELIGLKYCYKCKKIFKEVLAEVAY